MSGLGQAFFIRPLQRSLTWLALIALAVGCGEDKPKNRQTYTNCKLTRPGDAAVSIGGFPRQADRLPSTGTVNATVLFVDFPDAVATLTPAQAYAKISGATATFTEQSYGRMQYTMTTHLQWLRMSQNADQYSLFTYQGHLDYIQEAVNLADAAVNFSTTHSLVIIANPDSTGIGTRGPAMSAVAGYGITVDGNEIKNAVTSAYDLNTWGSIWLNHEITHNLGMIDLYAFTSLDSSNPWDTLRYTGAFSYMGFNSFTSNSPGLTAWERWLLGWIDDSQVQCANPIEDGQIVTLLTPIESSGGKKAVVVPVGDSKVLVVESRRRSGIDANMVKEGALVYTIDTSLSSGMGAMKVYPADDSDPLRRESTRAAGESVTVGDIRVEVISASNEGDVVRISDVKSWFRF